MDSGKLNLEESWTLLDFCAKSRFEELLNSVLNFIDWNFKICASTANFLKLSTDTIFTLLENKKRTVQEIDIFTAHSLESLDWKSALNCSNLHQVSFAWSAWSSGYQPCPPNLGCEDVRALWWHCLMRCFGKTAQRRTGIRLIRMR